jgi:hypothetical protein
MQNFAAAQFLGPPPSPAILCLLTLRKVTTIESLFVYALPVPHIRNRCRNQSRDILPFRNILRFNSATHTSAARGLIRLSGVPSAANMYWL